MSRDAEAGSASGSSVTSFPSTSLLPRLTRSYSDGLLISQCDSASSHTGSLSAHGMPTNSLTWSPPRPVTCVNVAAPAPAVQSTNASQVSPVWALSTPHPTATVTSARTAAAMERTSASRATCRVVAGCRISPKLTELLRAAATREDGDAPFLDVPAEVLLLESSCGTPSTQHTRRGEPATAAPLQGIAHAYPTEPPLTATSGAHRRTSPSSPASISAAEALMVDPDAPRSSRQHLSYKIHAAPRNGTNSARTSGVLAPLSGTATPPTSPFTKSGARTPASSPVVAYRTTAPPSITSPVSFGGAMLILLTPKSSLSGAEVEVTPALLLGGGTAVTPSVHPSAAQSPGVAATTTSSFSAATGALRPLPSSTPSNAHGGGQHVEVPLCFQGFAVYRHNQLERHISVSSRGRSSPAASAAVTTSVLERSRRTSSVASALSMSGFTDAPYDFDGFLDGAAVSFVGEADDLHGDPLYNGNDSGDTYEDGEGYRMVDDNDDDGDGSCHDVVQRRQRKVVMKGAMPPAAAVAASESESELELSQGQELTSMQWNGNVYTCATANFNVSGPVTRIPIAAHASSSRTERHLRISLMHTTGRSNSASSCGSGGGGSMRLSTFDRTTLTMPQKLFASQGALLRSLSTQTHISTSGGSHRLAGVRSGTAESPSSAPDLPMFVSTSYSPCSGSAAAAAAGGSGAGDRFLPPQVGKGSTCSWERVRCTPAGTVARPATRHCSTRWHGYNDSRTTRRLSGSLHRPLSNLLDTPGGAPKRVQQTRSSSGAEGRTWSSERCGEGRGRGRDRDRPSRASSGGENISCNRSSAQWKRFVIRPPPLHLCNTSSRRRRHALGSPAAADGHADGDDRAADLHECATSASLLPPPSRQALSWQSPATSSTTTGAAAEGQERDLHSAHVRGTTMVTPVPLPHEDIMHTQNRSTMPLGGANGSKVPRPLSCSHREQGQCHHRHGPHRDWHLRLPRLTLPYGTLGVLLTMATLVVAHVIVQCILSNSLTGRHTYVFSELVLFVEDFTLLPVMSCEVFTSSRSKDPARPSLRDLHWTPPKSITRLLCAVIQFMDLTESVPTLSHASQSPSEPRDEKRCAPLRCDDNLGNLSAVAVPTEQPQPITDGNWEGEHSMLDSSMVCISTNSSSIAFRGDIEAAHVTGTRTGIAGGLL
ncbi:hypothetical protein LPMP_080360 [Leishmania panamensis]|uniref:Uncharacterized protein n=1 Tax=Leishmania panamensis TaxID=5679 RepID=A0A088RJ68_LEIPA|nr:hypothetical protein LPMP_080360 [Leishmania panamensis]AIN95845.1 hypothetical protein LPMP_080360 [Leishmania panamensis]